MDRGRAGGFITDNNFVGVQFNMKKRKEHLDRLEKIMNRAPGSSHTLDNNPPVIIKAALTNPRKMAVKDYFYFVTERENKSLLKRIGSILTAPPKITDKDYLQMKKRCVSSGRGLKAQYEQRIVEKKNRDFFEHLKTVKPYYKAKVWEDDYNKQLFNQQFMRQVKYNRPPDFVDKLLLSTKQKENEQSKSPNDTKSTSSNKKFSSSHIDRIRAQKVNQTSGKSRLSKSGSAIIGSSSNIGAKSSRVGTAESNSYDEDFDHSDEDDYKNDHDNWNNPLEPGSRQNFNETKVSLAVVERSIKVLRSTTSDLNNGNGGSFMSEGYFEDVDFVDGTVECYLINREVLVVKAFGMDRGEKLEVEAEINLNSLSSLGDFSYNSQSLNLTMLNDIAQEMVENVEIKVDHQSDMQLVLNLFSENSEVDLNHSKDQDFSAYNQQTVNNSVIHEEDLSEMLLPDAHQKILSCGVKIPVSFIVSTGVQGINNIMLLIDYAKLAQKIEFVFALLTISSTVDDQLLVTAHFVSSTQYTYKRGNKVKPAVAAGTHLSLICPLPSIVQVDPDMILSFAENLSGNLKIEHDCKSGENNFIMT